MSDAATGARYFARSASDKTDDWPFWFIADRKCGELNVTVSLMPELRGYMPFIPKVDAMKLAHLANMADRDDGFLGRAINGR